MRRLSILVWLVLLALSSSAMAGDDLDAEGGSSALPKFSRQESLELPGLTACHQCEWRPSAHTMAAGERCGVDDQGKGKVALFECGFSQDCKRVCNFVRCGGDMN
ncbi:MAG: hypothetical protein EXR36_07735 [Betaproteobacteria bacterium]|nr:hypothetical protein [Betaproteobacteria bacterium]